MHVTETEKRIEFCRSKHVRNCIGVSNDIDGRRRSEHCERPIQNRKGPSGIDVRGHDRDDRQQDHASECFPENTHGGIIPITAVFSDSLLKQTLDRLYADFNYRIPPPTPFRSSGVTSGQTTVRSSGSVPPRSRSAAWRACCNRSRRLLAIAGPRPAAYVRTFEPSKEKSAFSNLVHRWIAGPDLVALLWLLRQILDRSGSIEEFFLDAYDPSAPDITDALESFSVRVLALDLRAAYGRVPRRPAVHYFFPRPSAGQRLQATELVSSMDGSSRCARSRRLVTGRAGQAHRPARHPRHPRRTLPAADAIYKPGWAMARDITATLSRLDPEDPVRCDFALCHLGMMNACGFNRGAG